MIQKITPQDHPEFVGGWVWTAMEIQWIEERITEAVARERDACADTARLALQHIHKVGEIAESAIRARNKHDY